VSNYKAIGAVTQTLIKLIDINSNTLPSPPKVLSQYPDKFFNANDDAINVHLYHVKESGNYKNNFLPHRNNNGGKTNLSYLCLELYYTISARSETDMYNDIILGHAMLNLFDNPILDKSYFSTQIETIPAYSDVNISKDNIENIKISLENLTVDEASKIWSMYGVKYRPSAYYKVSVLLMRNEQEFNEGLPVKEVMVTVLPKESIVIDEVIIE